jgi:phosphoglycerol transferase MdoB-like AlkP superfamily enzyme
MKSPWLRRTALAAALLFLDVSLTFENKWPTPAVRWRGELSIELAVCLLLLALLWRPVSSASRRTAGVLSGLWLVLVIGRYADVTAPALYGRDINVYWDLRYSVDVAAMLTRAAPWGVIVLVVAAALITLTALYLLVSWAFRRVTEGMAFTGERRAMIAVAVVVALVFAREAFDHTVSDEDRRVAVPVMATYAHQARLVMNARASKAGVRMLAPSPAMDSDLRRIHGADVLLVFIESYGAITYDRPEMAARLAHARSELASAVADTNRDVVSAFVQSPTFGGASWFAHISLMSGVQIGDPDNDALLMTEHRDTMAKMFARHGYHTVGWMPGLKMAWPEGSFYGFDEIDGTSRLDYHGPEFGWFAIPDQFSLARLDEQHVERPNRQPLFVFFPTLSTHTPFSPAPPYQPDWARVVTDHAYDQADVDRAFDQEIDWMNLSPLYEDAVEYIHTVVAGYLRRHADRDFVMILIGDHQPPALVSGQGQPWDVPVHIIASRQADREEMLERLRARGFRTGLAPSRQILGKMNELLPMLLDAFGNRQ